MILRVVLLVIWLVLFGITGLSGWEHGWRWPSVVLCMVSLTNAISLIVRMRHWRRDEEAARERRRRTDDLLRVD